MAKRAADFSDDESDNSDRRPAKKAATKKKPRLKKSKGNDWKAQNPEWTSEKPTGEHGKACVERGGLLAPYDPKITEPEWKKYYTERSFLDTIQTPGSAQSSAIISEELGQDTWKILKKTSAVVAAAILAGNFGTDFDDEKKAELARTTRASLYFIKLWGNDEGDGSPRTVDAQTCLYSPYGIGTSIDFKYDYHYRCFRANEKFSTLLAFSREIRDCSASKPTECRAVQHNANQRQKPAEGAVKLFDTNNKKVTGTTLQKVADLESTLFGVEGWLSPKLVFTILSYAGAAQCFNESIDCGSRKAAEKFKALFQGEREVAVTVKELAPVRAFVDGEWVGEAFLGRESTATAAEGDEETEQEGEQEDKQEEVEATETATEPVVEGEKNADEGEAAGADEAE